MYGRDLLAISRASLACFPAKISFSEIRSSIIIITIETPKALAIIIGKYIFLTISIAILKLYRKKPDKSINIILKFSIKNPLMNP